MSYYNRYNHHHNQRQSHPLDYNRDGRVDHRDGMIHAALDVNGDGRVDFNDGVIIGQRMRRSQRHPLDLNGDGRVDYKDGIIYGQMQNSNDQYHGW